jgi:putative ABC transport system permease protein
MSAPPLNLWLPLAQQALGAIMANRLRSALTMLGVVIGVASVILMLAIGEGSRTRVAETISSLGSNQLIVLSGAANSGGFRGAAGGLPNLTLEDAAAIGELYSVAGVAPVASSQAQVVFGSRNKSTSVTGTTLSYFAVNNMTLVAGRAFSDVEARTGANVAVLGATVAGELFGEQSPIGQTIRIQRQSFEVIGLLKAKGQGFGGGDQDDVILLPVHTAQRKLAGSPFPGTVAMVMVASALPDQKGYTQEEITRLLRQRHRIAPGADDDFSVRDVSALAETLSTTSRILSVLLGAIAFISLLVGGIGIMNIMLVSVTERTREIGVRMALGARRSTVLVQFLLESAALSLAGAFVGLTLGVGVAWLVGKTGLIQPVVSSVSVLVSLGVAVVVGVLCGFWPARRAAQLQPVEALRQQ